MVTAGRTSAPGLEPPNRLIRCRLVPGHEPDAELAQPPAGVEDRGAVDLGQGVAQRCQVRGPVHPQRRRHRDQLFDQRPRCSILAVGIVSRLAAREAQTRMALE